ncbi:uncharacterized protein N7511_010967 [Penicillium nucicola]|uniref:uncharacterized protein n=1 Tax=Penicillium nucicola TaxID=1850975 RepID=UPI0025455024|nr:uncharacterized protein N7511_010967 [Penicillium nucicola]KAJ5749271.1 hypothetical protein N7511_010967 [Penicillium nucicola]
MRLRSNHVLPDPNQVPPPARRRRQTRASSAQPTELTAQVTTEPAAEPATGAARRPAKKVSKKTRGKKQASRKTRPQSPGPEGPASTTSPGPSPIISQAPSPLAATPAVQSTDDRELDPSLPPLDPQETVQGTRVAQNDAPTTAHDTVPPQDASPQDTPLAPPNFMPESRLGARLFTIEEADEPFSPFQQHAQERADERRRAQLAEMEQIQNRLASRLQGQRIVQQRLDEDERRRAEFHRLRDEYLARESQASSASSVNPQVPSPSLPENDDEDDFVDAREVIDRKSESARKWLRHKKYSHMPPPPPLSPFSQDRLHRVINGLELPDPPGVWTRIKETQGLTYYKDGWGIKRVRQSDHPESSPAKRQKSSIASPVFLSSPRTRGVPRKSYADRTRRRQIEANGRIDRTIFRLPELLAQQQADAASNPARSSTNSHDTNPPTTPPPADPAPAPATVQANTSFPRAIFNSLTQRWTSLWGGTPAGQQAEQQPIVQEPQTPRVQNTASEPPASAPSAYHDARSHRETSPTSQQTGNPRVLRRATTRPYRPPRNYDLYPRGFDEALIDRCFVGQRKAPEKKQTKEKDTSNKRKRAPSPDVIPNPPGCSYGLHDDYFTYDDDDEAWAAEEQARRDAAKTATDSSEPATKKARVNFNHAGHFEVPYSSDSETSVVDHAPVPTNFNHSGHFEVPESSEPEESSTNSSPSSDSKTSTKSDTTKSSNREAQRTRSKRSTSPLTKARRTAEQHKPKTPSRLRAAHRFSLPPDVMDNLHQMLTSEDEDTRKRAATMLQACPDGDLRKIKWPQRKSWIDKLDLIRDDIRARDRHYRSLVLKDTDQINRDKVHKRFQRNVEILAKARRAGRCLKV